MLIDYINKNDIKYKKMLVVINKIDLMNKKIRNKIEINSQYLQISADTGFNLTKLKKSIYTKLELIRIYLKPKNGKPDFHDPLTMKKNSTILDICNKLHKNLKKDFRYCMVWGNSVKFDGQKVGLDHVIYDQDVVTIIKKNKT